MSRSTKNRPKGRQYKDVTTRADTKSEAKKPNGAGETKVLPSGQPPRARIVVVSLLAAVAVVFAVYRFTTSIRERHSLKSASLNDLTAASRRDPNDSLPLYYLGVRWLQLGQPAAAEPSFRRAADLDPDDEGGWLGAALADVGAGNQQEGLGIASLYTRRHPKSANGHFTLAQIFDKMGSVQNAYTEALAATALDPRNPNPWRLAGVEAGRLGNNAQAEANLRQATQVDPGDWRSRMELGRILAGLGRFAEAEDYTRQAIEIAPTEALPSLYLGRILLSQAQSPAQIDTARQYLQTSAKIQPNNAEVQHQLGLSEMRLAHWDTARSDLIQALRFAPADPGIVDSLVETDRHLANPTFLTQDIARQRQLRAYMSASQSLEKVINGPPFNAQAALALARLCAKNNDDLQAAQFYQEILDHGVAQASVKSEASAAIEQAASQSPLPVVSPDPTALSTDEAPVPVLLKDADALLRQGDAAQAQEAYLSILQVNIGQPEAYLGLARLARGQGNLNQAHFYVEKAVDFSPRLWQAQFALASLDKDMGLYKEATEHYRMGLSIDPNNGSGWHALGADLALVDDWYQDAEAALRQAVKLDPKNAGYLRDLADLQAVRNEHDLAEASYRKALALAPHDETTQSHLASFLIINHPTPAGLAEAGRLLSAAAATAPNDRAVSYWQGRLALEQGDARSAIPSLVYAAQHSHRQEAADSWYSLSRAYTATGDRESAAKALKNSDRMRNLDLYMIATERSVAENPHDLTTRLKLAFLYFQDRDFQECADQYQDILRIAPDNKAAKTQLAKLNAYLKAHPQVADSSQPQ